MRSHNKRQLDSGFNFLWFDQQSFKIKASYNKNNNRVHQHQFNVQIIAIFFYFNECDTTKKLNRVQFLQLCEFSYDIGCCPLLGEGQKSRFSSRYQAKVGSPLKSPRPLPLENPGLEESPLSTSNQTALDRMHDMRKL